MDRPSLSPDLTAGPASGASPYGMELVLDLHGCELKDLDHQRLEIFLVALCDLIDRKRHGEPIVWQDDSGVRHLHGVSAVQFIETSTIVCHPLPMLGAAFLNIFSCKSFDPVAAREYGVQLWQARSVHETVLVRT